MSLIVWSNNGGQVSKFDIWDWIVLLKMLGELFKYLKKHTINDKGEIC